MSREKVTKYFEVRLFSLAIVAVMILILFTFFLLVFIWRGQYFYALAIAAVIVIIAFAAVKASGYAKTLGPTESYASIQVDYAHLKDAE